MKRPVLLPASVYRALRYYRTRRGWRLEAEDGTLRVVRTRDHAFTPLLSEQDMVQFELQKQEAKEVWGK